MNSHLIFANLKNISLCILSGHIVTFSDFTFINRIYFNMEHDHLDSRGDGTGDNCGLGPTSYGYGRYDFHFIDNFNFVFEGNK